MSDHCWHYTSSITMGMGSTHSNYRCCWCNASAFTLSRGEPDPDHGPYDNNRILVEYERSPNWGEPCQRRIAEGA